MITGQARSTSDVGTPQLCTLDIHPYIFFSLLSFFLFFFFSFPSSSSSRYFVTTAYIHILVVVRAGDWSAPVSVASQEEVESERDICNNGERGNASDPSRVSDVCAGSESSGAWTEVEWPFRVLHKPREERRRSERRVVGVGGSRRSRWKRRGTGTRWERRSCKGETGRRPPPGATLVAAHAVAHLSTSNLATCATWQPRSLTMRIRTILHPDASSTLPLLSPSLLPSLGLFRFFVSLSRYLLFTRSTRWRDALADSREVLARRGRTWRECDCRLTLRFGSSGELLFRGWDERCWRG